MTQVSTTDRFELFKQLYKLVAATSTFTCHNISIVDAALSPLYLSLLSLNSKSQAQDSSRGSGLLARLKEKMNTIRHQKKINSYIEESRSLYKKAPYLFFPVEPTHLHQMVPVLQQFQKKGIGFLVVTNRLAIYDGLIAEGFHPVLIAYPGRREHTTVKTLFGQSGEKNLKKLVAEHFTQPYAQEYSKLFCDIIDHYTLPLIHQLSEVLLFIKPLAVVVGYDITLEGRILTRLAARMDIHSVCIQHGSISGEPLDHCHIVDKFLVYGNAARDYLISRGLSPSSCVVTGAPYLDKVKLANRPEAGILKRLLNISDQQPYILIALSGPGHSTSREHFNKVVTALLQASADYPDYQFVIKLHRKDNLNNYQELINSTPRHRIQIVENGKYSFEIFDWLAGCSLLITGTSTVAQEAMLMQVPVMTIDLMNEYKDVDFIDERCTVHITSEHAISSAIKEIINDTGSFLEVKCNASEYVRNSFYKLDGQAAKRCVEAICAC